MTKRTDLRPRYVTYLTCGIILVALAPQISDIATIWMRGRGVAAFEYPALARALYLMERAIADSRVGIALVNAAVGVAAATVIVGLLRNGGGRDSLWMAAPTLMLVTQNVEGITALLILLAVISWRQGRMVAAGLWVGIGAAFKLVPVFLLPPLIAASGWRGGVRVLMAAAVAWLAINVPYALLDPTGFRFPYQFALERPDLRGNLWAAIGVSGEVAAVASLVALGIICLVIAVATRRGKITLESGCALALLGFLGTSKLWQPHYLLWALAALALTNVPVVPVRCLEVANLAYFCVIWRQLPPDSEAVWLWPVAVVRLACLVWVATAVVRGSQRDPIEASDVGVKSGVGQTQPSR
jgi:hypothetical protein